MRLSSEENKLDRKSQEPHDFTHMQDVKLTETNEPAVQTNKDSQTDNGMVVARGKEVRR